MNAISTIEARNNCIGRLILEGYRIKETLPDGCLVIEDDKNEYTVNLENTVKNMVRDGDTSALDALLRSLKDIPEPLPAWDAARSGVYFSAEIAGQDLEGLIFEDVTPEIARVLAYVPPDESRIRWLIPKDLQNWSISFDQAHEEAMKNLNALLASTPVHMEQFDGMKLALLETNSILKASLIFSPHFQEKVAPELGWPVYAVVPCRDFAYLFNDEALIPRLGTVVVREYNESGYPLSTEVLKISDAGIGAIGAFTKRES